MLVYRPSPLHPCGCSDNPNRKSAAVSNLGFTPTDLTSTDADNALITGIPNVVVYAALAVAAYLVYRQFLSPKARRRRKALASVKRTYQSKEKDFAEAKDRYREQVARIKAKA